MKMAIQLYKYGRGWKCVCIFRYTSAGIRIENTLIEKEDRLIEKEDRHMSRVKDITIQTITQTIHIDI